MLPRPIAALCLIFAVGMISLWIFIPEDLLPYISFVMKQNTAVGIAFASLSLILLADEKASAAAYRLGRLFAVLTAAVGAATLFEYAVTDLKIDQLSRLDYVTPENNLYPGRMAPNAALLILLFGTAMYGRDYSSRGGTYLSDHILLITGVLAGSAVIGYVYQFSALFRVSSYLRISEYTASIFLLLTISAALSRPSHKPIKVFLSKGPAGVMARRLLPAAIVFPAVACWLTSRLRESEIINRPTGYALLAIALILVFSALIWSSVRRLDKSEKQRQEFFEAEKRTLATINRVGQNLLAELNMEKLVKGVTDAATTLTGAQFGAFFYNMTDADGSTMLLNTVSGVAPDKFASFGNPRSTAVFNPTFMNHGTVRSSDITKDGRYGQNDPQKGIPDGHPPVKSYLAVSVVSRAGEVIGGLFFGHEQAGVFTEQSEKIVEGLAAQTAIAMDNARLYQQLHDSVRARDEFLSIASHELKTPLTTLKLQSQTRERMINKGMNERFTMPGVLKMVKTDSQQIDRLARLVDDMLDIGRINTGKLTLNFETFDLNELAQEVSERFAAEFQAAGAELLFANNERVPVTADRHRMEQVMVNLLTNALKYGGKKPVEVAVKCERAKAVFEVRDHGMGIAKENQQRIFERFERAVTASEISGLGLGLFIVRQILNLHQGHIDVHSEAGRGATFSVRLPLAES